VISRDDLQRLIAVIVDEVSAAAARPAVRCACHAVSADCCPDRLQGVIEAGATRVGVHAMGGAPSSVASMIDHTLLKPDATRSAIEELCREAAQFKFATVCVNPTWVALCARLLRDSGVRVCSVVGFPLGATTADVKGYETRRTIFDGAREIDMVINVGTA
jgi:deoxyribose-phosphate aldolase